MKFEQQQHQAAEHVTGGTDSAANNLRQEAFELLKSVTPPSVQNRVENGVLEFTSLQIGGGDKLPAVVKSDAANVRPGHVQQGVYNGEFSMYP